MQKTLLTYVKPHVQEDPLSMILGIGYLGAQMEREGLPIALHDERIGTDGLLYGVTGLIWFSIVWQVNGRPIPQRLLS